MPVCILLHEYFIITTNKNDKPDKIFFLMKNNITQSDSMSERPPALVRRRINSSSEVSLS